MQIDDAVVKASKMMSPPSAATAGRTRVSSSSLIWADDLVVVFLGGWLGGARFSRTARRR